MNIIVFGDSISFGQYVSPHKTWVGQFSEYLEALSAELGEEILLQCEAVNGRTTRMALETMPQEVQKHRPDIVIVQFGLNDCNYWDSDEGLPRVSKAAFGANIQEIVSRCLNFGAKQVFVNTNHPTTRNFPLAANSNLIYQKNNEAYNQKIRDVLSTINSDKVALVDIEKAVFASVEKNSFEIEDFILPPPDALHLSILGHNYYFDYITSILNPVIKNILSKT